MSVLMIDRFEAQYPFALFKITDANGELVAIMHVRKDQADNFEFMLKEGAKSFQDGEVVFQTMDALSAYLEGVDAR